MANTNPVTPTVTTHGKRAIELYLHGLAVYAAYPERRSAEHMYEIKRVSEAFNEADHIAYTSNEAQRQWWITAHNAFCDVTCPAGATFDKELAPSLHDISQPHASASQDRASVGQLDQLPKTLIGKERDLLTGRKNSTPQGPPAVSAFVTRDFHQPVEASTEHHRGANIPLGQPSPKTTAELATVIENPSFDYPYKKLEPAGKNAHGSAAGEVAASPMKSDRPTQAARPSFAEQKLAPVQGSTFKELDETKGALKFHLDAAVDAAMASRDGLNLQEILNDHMKRALLETDPHIRSHKLEDCVRNAAFVLEETKARFCETSHALLYTQMERESLDRKIEFAQLDFIEERGKRKQAQVSLAIAVDKAEKTRLENYQLKRELIFLRAELDSKTAR